MSGISEPLWDSLFLASLLASLGLFGLLWAYLGVSGALWAFLGPDISLPRRKVPCPRKLKEDTGKVLDGLNESACGFHMHTVSTLPVLAITGFPRSVDVVWGMRKSKALPSLTGT